MHDDQGVADGTDTGGNTDDVDDGVVAEIQYVSFLPFTQPFPDINTEDTNFMSICDYTPFWPNTGNNLAPAILTRQWLSLGLLGADNLCLLGTRRVRGYGP